MKKVGKSSSSGSSPIGPRLKLFRPVSWYRHQKVHYYIEHLMLELGRLGLGIEDIEGRGQTVLRDLMDWLSGHPGEAYAKLVDGQRLNLARLQTRDEFSRTAKPRIEISAYLNQAHNLCVNWYPKGWHNERNKWNIDYRSSQCLFDPKAADGPDFLWFEGDEGSYFTSRSSNELLYLRGVGNLYPEPCDSYGPYATFNRDVVHSVLICAVRAAYEGLIEKLRHSFEVDVLDSFDFEVREEPSEDDEQIAGRSVKRVVSWRLLDSADAEANAKERSEREELAGFPRRYGCTVEQFVDTLVHASSQKSNGRMVGIDIIHRNAARELRNRGARINGGDVQRIRQLVEHYLPDALPAELRSSSLGVSQTK